MWFGHKLDPTGTAFSIGQYTDIRGPIDPDRFAAATRQVVAETETLRLCFEESERGPRQRVAPVPDWSLNVVDVSGRPAPVDAARSWMAERLSRPFEPTRAPLFDWTLIKVVDDRFIWCQICHHLVLDAYSGSLLAKRVAEVYGAVLAGNEPPCLETAPLAELVAEEGRYRNSERWSKDRKYWQQLLDGRPEPVQPAEQPPATPAAFNRAAVELPANLADTLRHLAQKHGGSLPALMVAAVALYVHRVTGARGLVISIPVLGRSGSVVRRTPAMMANTIPLS